MWGAVLSSKKFEYTVVCNDSACGFNIHAKFRAAAAAAAEDEAPVMEKPSWGGDSDSDEDSGKEGDESTHR